MTFVFEEGEAGRAPVRLDATSDETRRVAELMAETRLDADDGRAVRKRAIDLVAHVRANRRHAGGIDAFMHEYDLSSHEGVAIMCLAEALLRIPDASTALMLIQDKIGDADWGRHLGDSESLFVNASTWGLMLTGRLVSLDPEWTGNAAGVVSRFVSRLGEPVIREAFLHAMRIVGRQFVMGRDIDEALANAGDDMAHGYTHSFDMLGEAACTMADADRHLEHYRHAIERVGEAERNQGQIRRASVSVKLSALHPRYEMAQRSRVLSELAPRLITLGRLARDRDIDLTVDAEEADRLELSLDVLAVAARDLAGWNGLGLAVQAYQKRAMAVIDWLACLASETSRRFPVRLVKGAYWDSEIKRAQELGLESFPVFTRKASTDLSYIACARKLLARPDLFFPQFATHNAQTIATILVLAGGRRDIEFQRLHGMGQAVYRPLVAGEGDGVACRVYSPVGGHDDLLPYLVRRLLENGANTSFVNRIVDDSLPIEDLVKDPATVLREADTVVHPAIPRPPCLYGEERRNARGFDLTREAILHRFARDMDQAVADMPWVVDRPCNGTQRTITSPADRRRIVGTIREADERDLSATLSAAREAARDWSVTSADSRASCLESAADLLERDCARLMATAVLEGGKTISDALAEVREAVDFLRYYAMRARAEFAGASELPGPTGESNRISLHGRGVFACISPWNFPLAIFCGQVAAALAAGNAVVAKPAEQTPLMAARAVHLFHEAGIPEDVLSLLPGNGATGAALVSDPRIDGVAFTGSTATARLINRSLAGRSGAIVPLIAETGGQNAMIVDSTALPEQVTLDVIRSGITSARQRCSALRVLCLQEEIADRVITMLSGAMAELKVGDPALINTDVGPVIDREALAGLESHLAGIESAGRILFRCSLEPDLVRHGTFLAPALVEIPGIALLEREVFGPIIHVVRFAGDRLPDVLDDIIATGFGLTLGIHTRIDSRAQWIAGRMPVGNIYVNRNMIGAVVGSQPFGGERLSGTGPKAGGPHYLHRFATERVVSTNTTAGGGNATLMSLGDA